MNEKYNNLIKQRDKAEKKIEQADFKAGADVKIMDRFFRHREEPDSENFSKPGFQLKTA
ncbi:hypothetical protein J3323_08035 [Leuconostoc mesenteroides]|uniref:hypothetical protein n=1 Tax=Leuconostoc mesenteroides TaxID=1245 RepID=UPI001CBDCF1C|nr:hypothetical protein [Leuconostoc mesenteroides]MBZ1529848.1 hypothetical protein [Leuconostoc mesenteroides]